MRNQNRFTAVLNVPSKKERKKERNHKRKREREREKGRKKEGKRDSRKVARERERERKLLEAPERQSRPPFRLGLAYRLVRPILDFDWSTVTSLPPFGHRTAVERVQGLSVRPVWSCFLGFFLFGGFLFSSSSSSFCRVSSRRRTRTRPSAARRRRAGRCDPSPVGSTIFPRSPALRPPSDFFIHSFLFGRFFLLLLLLFVCLFGAVRLCVLRVGVFFFFFCSPASVFRRPTERRTK